MNPDRALADGTVKDEVALLCNAEYPSCINAANFPSTRTFWPSGSRRVTSREDEEVLESRDEVGKSGPGDSTPIASSASMNEAKAAITPTMNLVCINCGDDCFGKSGFDWQAFSPCGNEFA
jgi:hypothetical protein